MKSGRGFFVQIVCFFLVFMGLFLARSTQASDPMIEVLSRKGLVTVNYPDVAIENLPNGMRVYLMEDHELPVFQAFAYIRGGSVFDPPEKVGRASLMGGVLRTGGTQKRSVGEIDRLLENRGASLETGMAHEYGTAGLQGLSKDLNDLIPLFFEVLSSPRFDPGQLDLARRRKIEAIQRQNDDPEKIAFREFPKLIYGPESIWARSARPETLSRVDRNDLFQFHERFYHPDRVVLAIAGDFKKEEILSLLRKSTEGWKKSETPLPQIPSMKKEWKGGVAVIERKGVQSTVIVGQMGDKRTNPDKFALILMNYMLGGDVFSSRLGEEVRSDRGLAYSIYSHFGLETDYGLFFVMAQTRSEATGEVVGLIEKEILNFHQAQGFSETSLRFAKGAILNQLVGDWEPRFNYVKERARLNFYGYPEDYLKIYREKLGAVTLAQVKEAAKNYLFPDRLQVLAVGDLESLDGQLRKFGEVKKLPLDSF